MVEIINDVCVCVWGGEILHCARACNEVCLNYLQVQEAKTTEELSGIVGTDEYDFRFDCGYTKPTCQLKIADRDQMVKCIWLHFIFFMPHAELEQLKQGFQETLRMDQLVALHSSEIRSFLVLSSDFDITPTSLLGSFVVCYSDKGSNKRVVEEAVMLNWSDYILDLDG